MKLEGGPGQVKKSWDFLVSDGIKKAKKEGWQVHALFTKGINRLDGEDEGVYIRASNSAQAEV